MNLDDVKIGETECSQTKDVVNDNPIDKNEFKIFKDSAIDYLNLQSEIKLLKQQLAEQKKKSNDLEKIIKDYMDENDIYNHDTQKGIVKFIKTYQKPFRNKETTKKKLSEYFNSDEKAVDCLKFIDNIEKIEKTSLKVILK